MSSIVPLHEFQPSADIMPAFVARHHADRDTFDRHYVQVYSQRRTDALRAFLKEWLGALDKIDFAKLTQDDKADWLLFKGLMNAELVELDQIEARFKEISPLVPGAQDLLALEDARRMLEFIQGEPTAELLNRVTKEINEAREKLDATNAPMPAIGYRGSRLIEDLLKRLEDWFNFYNGYDPLFTWWVEKPYESLKTALEAQAKRLKELAGAEDPDTIIGDPVGRDALVTDLQTALIPYSPEELIAIGEREMQWCLTELKRASNDMGCGEDWRAAMEKTKQGHEAPGSQPQMIKDLALEAIEYVEKHDLLTIPPVARQGWHMEMMSPEAQKVNPFFLGGEDIIVSFPTNEMEHDQKLMSMRGNNRAFARATVHHELIPGHYMQSFYHQRSRPYRNHFWTPFWTEGWTLYWEMLLWDRKFPRTPEERMGMLFWRAHRCARIVFSLKFHLGEMTPMECVEMLVNDVGHERDTAMGEVRRSFKGDYPPLYQLAYQIGGLQVYALRRELVDSGKMGEKAFHDGFLRANCMPIAMVRALLSGQELNKDGLPEWRFD
jgi:uncharacterized protein (DUF885 family)